MAQIDIAVYYDHDGHAIWLHDKNYYLFQIQMKNNWLLFYLVRR